MQKGIADEVKQPAIPPQTEQQNYKVSGTFSFRNKDDYEIFHTLMQLQEQEIDEFVTDAVYRYIVSLLQYPSELLNNPNIKKLEGLTFGGFDEDDYPELPKPGEERVGIRSGYSNSTYTHKETFVGVFEGKSAPILDEMSEAPSFNWESITYKGRQAYAFWLSDS